MTDVPSLSKGIFLSSEEPQLGGPKRQGLKRYYYSLAHLYSNLTGEFVAPSVYIHAVADQTRSVPVPIPAPMTDTPGEIENIRLREFSFYLVEQEIGRVSLWIGYGEFTNYLVVEDTAQDKLDLYNFLAEQHNREVLGLQPTRLR